MFTFTIQLHAEIVVQAIVDNAITQAAEDICEFDASSITILSHMFLPTQSFEQ